MKLPTYKDDTVTASNQQNQETGRRLINRSPITESNEDTEALTSNRNNTSDNTMPESEEDPINILRRYHGREWSEVEHLLKVPDLENEDEDDEESDWSPEPSQVSSDSHDDPFEEDIHDLVNVLDNVIRSQSNLRCDATRIVDYLDLDINKYETVLSEVQNWMWEPDDLLDDDPITSSEINTTP